MDRPSTPLPEAYLLTPPPTGRFDKQENFTDNNINTKINKENPNSRRSTKAKEGESPTAFFEDTQESSDSDLDGLLDAESITASDDTAPASPVFTTPNVHSQQTLDLFAPLTFLKSPVPTEPFPLLSLPISIRNRIYTHLLVVPGLVCIRQNQTAIPTENATFLHTERRSRLPGFSHALARLTVSGSSIPFSRFATTNVGILLASKEIHLEARAVLYGKNIFAIPKPSLELSPPADFSVRLFPAGCQRLITRLTICIRSFYDLTWLLSKGCVAIKNYYRGLRSLTLILELESTNKGFGKMWARKDEKWEVYVKRLQGGVARDLCGEKVLRTGRMVPTWIDLRVLFAGEAYDEKLRNGVCVVNGTTDQDKREDLRAAMVEAWELFKKGGR